MHLLSYREKTSGATSLLVVNLSKELGQFRVTYFLGVSDIHAVCLCPLERIT
jgi:hypothetical protein